MSQDIINKNQDISYTNLDFSSIYTEIVDLAKQLSYRWDPSISDESDPGVVLLKLSALIADKMNYNIDKSALEAFPLSVTQDGNARQLYDQLGYAMNWYESASVLANISWIGEVDTDKENVVYTIPKFTIITDSESSRSYAIIGTIDSNGLVVSDIKLPRDRSVVQFVAIEGTPVRFSFLGETVITPEMIDENNRLYLDTQYVSQNGIFIRNSGNNQDNFLEWRRVDNLYEQPYNDLRYRLGIDSSANVAYLEFPDNYAELIGAGIEITYMVIDPEYSDVPAQVLDRFLVSVNPIEDTDVYLSYDNVKIENIYASSGHKDRESIDEAYANYKKTVGTFKTLITLRDYLNYILLEGAELCSNGFVTDRTNDPQLTYKIMSKLNGLDSLLTEVEAVDSYQTVEIAQEDYKENEYYIFEGNEFVLDSSTSYSSSKTYFLPKSEDKLLPFSLKFYLLQDAIAVNSKTTFEQTFNMIATEDLPSIDALLEDTSHIQHTYEDILPLGENKYKLTEDILRSETKSYYYYDTDTQRYEFISNTYYRLCTDTETTVFVEIEITPEEFITNTYYEYDETTQTYTPCTTWDGTTQLYTVGVFYLYNSEYDYYYTYELPDGTDELNAINPYDLGLYVLEDLTTVDTINPSSKGWYEIDIEALSPHVAYFRAKYPINMDITTFSVVGKEVQSDIKSNVLAALYENLNSTQLNFGDKIELDYLTEIVLAADSRIKSVVFSNIEYRIEAMYYDTIHGFVGVILPVTISAPIYSDETSVLSYNICKDIFAKSILAGRTKLLDQDTQFEYHLNQSYLGVVNGIYSIESEATIDMKNVSAIEFEDGYESRNYTLKENETLTLIQPDLPESVSYEKGIHYEYLIDEDIEAYDSYKLSSSEYMIFYTPVTDDNGEVTEYKCNVYTNNAIIKPSFDLEAQPSQSALSKYFTTEIQPDIYNSEDTFFEYTTTSSYWTNYIQNNSSIINNVISASDDITVQKMGEVTIVPTDGYQFYWILNKEHKAESTGKKFYQLFDSYNSTTQKKQNSLINTYTLKTGEAFYYMDKDGKNLAILHAGDTIIRNTGINSSYTPVESDLYSFIPVIIEGNEIDLSTYDLEYIVNEEDEIDPYQNGFYEMVDTSGEISPDNMKLSEDESVDTTKTYYVLVMNSVSGFYENNNNVYTPSPTTTYNIFKSIGEIDDDELFSINPSSSDTTYFEKVTAQGVEIEDIYPAGNNVEVTFNPDAPTDTPKWSVSGDFEESIVARQRFKNVEATSILNPEIDLGDYSGIDVNDIDTYPTESGIKIDSSSIASYSPLNQDLYEVPEYTKVEITEFEDGVTYYTYNVSDSTYEEVTVEPGDEPNPNETYYIGPKFYTFYTTSLSLGRAYISSESFSDVKTSGRNYYKASRTYQIISFGATYYSDYTYCACVEKDSNNHPTVYTPLNVTKAQPGIQYYLKDDNDEYVPYSFPVGSDITIAQVYVKGYQLLGLFPTAFNYIPVGNFTSSDFSDNVTSVESYLARYNTVTYEVVSDEDEYDTYGEYYTDITTYTEVNNVTSSNIPTCKNWYECEEYDSDIQYYVFDEDLGKYVLPSQQPSQSDYGTDGVEYFIKDGDDYYSMYYKSTKIYSYIPQGIIKSSADTPFVRIPPTENGGLGCYYKVGENDLTYIKRTVNEDFITITATNNNLPKTLYDIIKNYRVLGKELSTISLNDVVSNWSYSYSICTPKDFYVRKFVATTGTPEYYAINIDAYGNTIKSALSSNMSSVHTIFPYYGSIGGYAGSYIVMDASLYQIIQTAISFNNGIAVQIDFSTPYIKLTDKTMQLWYQIIESYVGIANQPYVYMYFIPEYYRFRYLYTTDVDKYYVLKEYVDKDFGVIDPWECDSLTSNFVANNPAKALTNMWKPLQDNCSITLRQNDLYTLTEGDTITLTSKVASNVITWPTFTNVESILNSNNYDTSYTKSNNEIVYLDNISIDGAEWRVYSNLLVNTSTGKGQQLAPNHKITFYDRDADELNVIPDDLENYDSNTITMFQLETPINNRAGDYIQAFTYDDLGNEVLNNAYIYKQLLSSSSDVYDVTYSSDNTTHVVIHDVSEESKLEFKFPQGKYLLPLQGVEDSETAIEIKKITTGYSPTIDTTIDDSKTYYELDITECIDLTEFEEDTDYYKIGISSFDADDDGYGITKDDVPKAGITYYTIIATEYDPETSTASITDLYEVDKGIIFFEAATDFASGSSTFNANKSYYIYVDNQDGLVQELGISVASPLTLVFGNLFKYENVYDDFIHEELLNKIKAFDTDSIFNYTYQPADNELIENPVLPKSFWDKNHVYNACTIAQLDTSSTDNINYRFITSK